MASGSKPDGIFDIAFIKHSIRNQAPVKRVIKKRTTGDYLKY